MIDFVREIREQKAQGATEMEILSTLISAYDRDEIDFEELMERVRALNSEYGTKYDVSPLEAETESSTGVEDSSVEQQADDEQLNNLFGMKSGSEKEEEKKEEQSTMEE